MWMRGYTNQSSSNSTNTTTSADNNNNNGCGAIDQFGNPITLMMPLPTTDPSFNGRRLRPLIPKPTLPPPCFNHGSCDTTNNNNNDFFPLNQHMTMSQSTHHLMGSVVDQQGRRRDNQFNNMNQSIVVSSRWNPTPEQLRALEELYRRGTRTPSAVQIQHITSQLRRYGKIEGKNVFYWFQNHKARERQKRRRQQLDNSSSPNDRQQSLDHHHHHHHHEHQSKEPAPGNESNHNENKGSTTGYEIEQTKGWTVNINCSTLLDQESVHKSDKVAAECVTDDEWVQFQDHHNSMQIATSTVMFQADSVIEEQHRRRRTCLSQLTKSYTTTWDNSQQQYQPLTTSSSYFKPITMVNEACEFDHQDHVQGNNIKEGALSTLELFPLRSNVAMDLMKDDDDNDGDGDDDIEDKETHLTSYQFFEFLPLKNSTAY